MRGAPDMMAVEITLTVDDWNGLAQRPWDEQPGTVRVIEEMRTGLGEKAGPELDGSSRVTLTLTAPPEYWAAELDERPYFRGGYGPNAGLFEMFRQLHAIMRPGNLGD